ncbi:MAG TPA: hypothetical protein VIY08_05210 [Candidatus Nitrosocosmicus sp.]
MFQILINYSGLSLGETEVINNLFEGYNIYQFNIDNDFEFASILEIEFIKDDEIPFFDIISIEKWSFLIEIIKNIKKRRGKKGLRFKLVITEIFKIDKEHQEPKILRRVVFILNQKSDIDFIKGLERIEISIENLDEIYRFHEIKEEKITNNRFDKHKDQDSQNNTRFFIFNEDIRKWTMIK